MTPIELKQWRKTNGYTQTRLAKALDVYQVTIARWENDVRKIPSFLHLALRCLELEGDELLKGLQRKRKRKGGVKYGKCLQATQSKNRLGK
jgi:DNA-binding XRE family transcriptional regulator